jgi:hypothetical protein
MPRRQPENTFTVADVVAHLGRLGDTLTTPIDATITVHNRVKPVSAEYASWTARTIQYVDVLLDRIDELQTQLKNCHTIMGGCACELCAMPEAR